MGKSKRISTNMRSIHQDHKFSGGKGHCRIVNEKISNTKTIVSENICCYCS